ncbi:uncharacterized protein LOC127835515 [Dreissena polymorpha]|uniref:uncharacterized protein LOC127835515 n=1 Tax=Dreissena polymorpha TaxID=45954 RepID=UPI00226503EF|nr:uncharacterized protein LOC127835515 [Dreissena polymorpha]
MAHFPKFKKDRRIQVKKTEDANGGSLEVSIKSLQCADQGTYFCAIDTYKMWPLKASISIITPPEDSLRPSFPTEVFEDKVANFSCSGQPGYPSGKLVWKIKHEKDADFKQYDFYSARSNVSDVNCIRSETNTVEYQFDMAWNNTKIRCYIDNTDYFGEGVIRLLPYNICNRVRAQGTINHPYTPHKYIVCGKELNIMQCPGQHVL